MNGKNKKQKKGAGVPLLKPLFILLLIGFFCFIIARKTFLWIKSSSYFRVKRITCMMSSKPRSLENLLYLRNQSMFDIDLVGLQKKLEQSFPEVAQIRALKRFPDEIRIIFKERPAYAVIALGTNQFVIDRQGFIISKGGLPERTFPLIEGIGSTSRSIALGQMIASDNLKIALKVLDIFAQNKILHSFSIVKIDVSNLSKISFYLSDQLEIVIDKENIQEKIDTLGVILIKAKLDWERIRYIDLRFEEPVIKYDE